MKDAHGITAAILVGGLGTRLRSVVSDKPKVLAEVFGRPFLSYLLDQLMVLGVGEVVLCSGYMADKIQQCFGDTYGSLRLLYSREDKPLGTGGAIRLALPCFSSDTILVMNGDSYVEADLIAYTEWFFSEEREVALLLTKVSDTTRYASVTINENKTIATFEEKCHNSGSGLINAGVYLMKKSIIASLPERKFYSLERELFPTLIGQKLWGFCCKGRFIDIGVPESYATARYFFAAMKSADIAE